MNRVKQCIFLLPLLLLTIAADTPPDPSDGWTPAKLTFKVQYPYNLNKSDRYAEKDGTYHLWVFNDDQPFSKGNTTLPRTEMRFPELTKGQFQFEADMMAPTG